MTINTINNKTKITTVTETVVYYSLRSKIGTFEKRINSLLNLGDSSLATATPLAPRRGNPTQIRCATAKAIATRGQNDNNDNSTTLTTK